MDSMAAFAMAQAHRGCEKKVFDWDKAAEIIKERKPQDAVAGLKEDMEWTCAPIYEDGQPVCNGETYLASNWATPVLELFFKKDGETKYTVETLECYVMESQTQWNAETQWPLSSVKILFDFE